MSKLHVPLTVRTVRLIALMLLIREEPTTRGAVLLLFTHCPRNLLLLCLSKHTRLLKVLLHDSHGIGTWENAHGGTDIQSLHACSHLCHVHIASFGTRFAHIPFCHRPCNIYDYIVVTCDFIIKKVNSFFSLDLSMKHYVFTI